MIVFEYILNQYLVYKTSNYICCHSVVGCKCSSEHNITTDPNARVGGGKRMEAYCDFWSSSDFKWCFLANIQDVEKCPGAVKSGREERDVYWTQHEDICKGLQSFVLDLS